MNFIRVACWKVWNKYQLRRLADTRAAMHLAKFITKEHLIGLDKKFKWVVVTKEI
jgi:hypothetical protein